MQNYLRKFIRNNFFKTRYFINNYFYCLNFKLKNKKPILSLESHNMQSLSESNSKRLKQLAIENLYLSSAPVFKVPGYCVACNIFTRFHVDYLYCSETDGKKVPNWRERLVCPSCHLNNRMRAAIHIFSQIQHPNDNTAIYITESVTALFKYFDNKFSNVVSSEYLGEAIPFGQTNDQGVRNETLTALTFAAESFDVILSFDVFEHIPDFKKAFAECCRVLKKDGKLIFTVPFSPDHEKNIVRAIVNEDGQIIHLLPPEYHGDPLLNSGCLAYYHFGWEIVSQLKESGFSKVNTLFYWSEEFGYFGPNQMIIVATK